jgi:hypothetical protein
MGGVTPIVEPAVALARIVIFAEHLQIAWIKREPGIGSPWLHMVDIQFDPIVLGPTAQFAASIIRAQRLISNPPPLGRHKKVR